MLQNIKLEEMKKTITLFSGILMAAGIYAQSFQINAIGSYNTGVFDDGAAEITAYDTTTQRLFFVNASNSSIQVLDISNPALPKLQNTIILTPYGASANSVAFKNGVLAAAVEDTNKQANGKVVFFDAAGVYLNDVPVGALPDMLTFSPDGNKIVVANEGEPNDDYTIDPEGSVSIIDISAGVSQATVSNVSFALFNNVIDSLESGMPSGWLNAGGYFNTSSANSGNGKAGLNTTGDIIRTGKYSALQGLSFYAKISSAGANWQTSIEISQDSMVWTAIDTIIADGNNTGDVVDSIYRKFNYNVGSSLPHYVRFNMYNRIGGSFYFDDIEVSTISKDVRVFGPNATVAMDLEPEYITVDQNNAFAYVSCQENNAIVKVDLSTATAVEIMPLGYKDWSAVGNTLDASDKDGVINMRNYPIKGMYMPDAIDGHVIGGNFYIFTANEGDSRDYDGFSEEDRIKDIILDSIAFPNYARLQDEDSLGRLNITNTMGDIDNDGDFDELYSYGARSFSIFSTTGALIYDSGDDFESYIAANHATHFNSNNDDNDSFDKRSDDKGVEPEAIIVEEIRGKQYAFIGLERMGGIMVYDVSNVNAPTFEQYFLNRNFSAVATDSAAGDLGPEGLFFIPASVSPNGLDLLVASNEISGNVSIYSLSFTTSLIENGIKGIELSIYPNPSKGNTVNLNKMATGSIFNMIGKEVVRFDHTNTIDISSLTEGMYIIKTTSGESQKLIKN